MTSFSSSSFQAWRVHQAGRGKCIGAEETLQQKDIDDDDCDSKEVLLQITHSSLNYKDALSASGNRGVTRSFPHTPGIDAAGSNPKTGESVLVTGYDLGMNTDGGFGESICVPKDWVVSPNPFLEVAGHDLYEAARISMIYGTAGLTAALCVTKLLHMKASPKDGSVLVTGSSGGVGSIVIEILSKLGFQVVAVSGKSENAYAKKKLMELGAAEVVGRDALKANGRPLLTPTYAHAIDTVGGGPLAEVLKLVKPGGSVVCCGNAAGLGLETTVLPFILRGINLLGVDSVEISLEEKKNAWTKLATDWRCPVSEKHAMEIGRHDLDEYLQAMLKGKSAGRVVLDHSMTL